MSTRDERKLKFARTFMRLVVDSRHNRRVSVVDITNALGCERKTFYYYFENIDDLVIWIVRHTLKSLIEQQFSQYPHIRPDPSLCDPYADWPFYVRIEYPGKFLAQGPYFKATTYHWEDNRAYYSSMFRNDERSYGNLFEYLVRLYTPALKDDIRFMLNGKTIPEDALNFLAEYHVMGIFGRLQWHFACTRQFIMQQDLDPYWNYAHTCIRLTIDRLGTANDDIALANKQAMQANSALADFRDIK